MKKQYFICIYLLLVNSNTVQIYKIFNCSNDALIFFIDKLWGDIRHTTMTIFYRYLFSPFYFNFGIVVFTFT